MSSNEQLVSIITPLYNGEKFIKQTLESVLNQSYQNWELIIIDDNSTDKSVSIVEMYLKKDSRIKLIRNYKNLGPALSRNKGIELSTGDYIAFLDGDDIWFPYKLKNQIEFMKSNNVFFSYSYYDQINEDGKFIKQINNLPLKVNYISTIKSNKIGCLTAVYDVLYFGKIYMEDIAKRQDYTLWLKLLKKIDFAYCVPESLASYRIRKDSISSNKIKLIKYHWIIYNKIEGHNKIKSFGYLLNYIFMRIFNPSSN